jgi:hypothetical protein
MFSINSLNGNSFFDIALQYQKMAIKELGDESYQAPFQLRDIEKSSLSSTGDDSFSRFVSTFDKLHSLITTYVYKRDSNTINSTSKVDDLKTKMDDINEQKAASSVRNAYLAKKIMFDKIKVEMFDKIKDDNDFDRMKQDIIDLINANNDGDSKEYFIISYRMASDVIKDFVKGLRANSKYKPDFKRVSDSFDSMEVRYTKTLNESLKDEKDEAVLDAEAAINKSFNNDKAQGAIGELNSLSDGALLASDLYDVLNRNFGVWNSLIKSNDIILKKGDAQFKIKEDSLEMLGNLTQEKYAKEGQTVYKKVLKFVKLLNQLIQQLGSNASGESPFNNNNNQFVGNASNPTRAPSTGFNTNQVVPVVEPVGNPVGDLDDGFESMEEEEEPEILAIEGGGNYTVITQDVLDEIMIEAAAFEEFVANKQVQTRTKQTNMNDNLMYLFEEYVDDNDMILDATRTYFTQIKGYNISRFLKDLRAKRL